MTTILVATVAMHYLGPALGLHEAQAPHQVQSQSHFSVDLVVALIFATLLWRLGQVWYTQSPLGVTKRTSRRLQQIVLGMCLCGRLLWTSWQDLVKSLGLRSLFD